VARDGHREFRRALQRALEAAGRRLCRTKLERAGQREQNAQVAGGIVGSAIAQRNRNCEIGPRIVAQKPAYAAANRNQRDSVGIAIAGVPLRLRPNDADTLDSRGFTFFKFGRFDDAIADCDAALKLQP
jgi:tetratricopeptide (TPR) repeat protein